MKLHFVESMDEVLRIALEARLSAADPPVGDDAAERRKAHSLGFFLHQMSGILFARGHSRRCPKSYFGIFVERPGPEQFPKEEYPEIAFLGRSNVLASPA